MKSSLFFDYNQMYCHMEGTWPSQAAGAGLDEQLALTGVHHKDPKWHAHCRSPPPFRAIHVLSVCRRLQTRG